MSVESDANYRCDLVCCSGIGGSKDQAAALDAVVRSRARWMLDTQLDRRAESSVANETDFVA